MMKEFGLRSWVESKESDRFRELKKVQQQVADLDGLISRRGDVPVFRGDRDEAQAALKRLKRRPLLVAVASLVSQVIG